MSYVERLSGHIAGLGYGCLATLMGRYYAMDRDKRYERTQLAYEGLIKGVGERVELSQLTKVGVDWLIKLLITSLPLPPANDRSLQCCW